MAGREVESLAPSVFVSDWTSVRTGWVVHGPCAQWFSQKMAVSRPVLFVHGPDVDPHGPCGLEQGW